MKNQTPKIVKIGLTGGGTGGHLIPLVAVVRELKKILKDRVIFYYLGPVEEITVRELEEEGVKIIPILAGKIRRYFSFSALISNCLDFFKMILGVFQSFFFILYLGPDLIFSKGGYGSFPVTLSAWLWGIPIFLHESDSILGLANKILSKFAKKVFVAFPQTENVNPKKAIVVGNPIRTELLGAQKEEGRAFFKFFNEKPVLLILGGSQGAQRINEKVVAILNELLKKANVIHQCGEKNISQIQKSVNFLVEGNLLTDYRAFGYLRENELKMALAASDVVVARAGAGTIFEIAATGKPSILIPLPESAQNHQLRNAFLYSKQGAAILIEEKYLTPKLLLERIEFLLSDEKVRQEMSKKAQEFANPSSALLIANYLISYLTK